MEDLPCAYQKPQQKPATVHDVLLFETTWNDGTFPTKSGGTLAVNFALPYAIFPEHFFFAHNAELDLIGKDIRGLRSYRVDDLTEGNIGGKEYHRIRQELTLVSRGNITLHLEDVYGNQRTIPLAHDLEKNTLQGVYIPPFLLHTYCVQKSKHSSGKTGLVVICNTLFNHYDLRTKDTYSEEAFKELQKQFI